jgi:hypothetical protein
MSPHMVELGQVGGALLILGGFAGQQLGQLDSGSLPYLLLNIFGAGILALVAYLDRDWGFLLLEGSWAVVSLASVRRSLSHNAGRHMRCMSRRPIHQQHSVCGWSP